MTAEVKDLDLSTSIVEEEEEEEEEVEEVGEDSIRKKKKKKRKTPGQRKAAAAALLAQEIPALPSPPPVILKISRNKHMKYISSYHGPWLAQLPQEVLDSLLQVNCDPQSLPSYVKSSNSTRSNRYRALLESALAATTDLGDGEEDLPPLVDPSVFRAVVAIRRLVEEASDLAVRASSGLSSAALGALSISNGMGFDNSNNGRGGGRNSTMSPIRQHRLRGLAVTKLAECYRIDEIATSVAVMQGSTGLDDLASRVLRIEPSNVDAQYVNFFHEKIPSRTLAISTDTALLSQLITLNPLGLQYYRTRGIVHAFKQDYTCAIKDFTQALTQARLTRKANLFHEAGLKSSGNKKKGKPSNKNHVTGEGKEPSTMREEAAGKIGKEAGDDLERQLFFHRGMAHFHFACKLIEDAVLDIEEVERPAQGLSNEGGELTLRNVGIILKDELVGLYGSAASSTKQETYRTVLQDPELRGNVNLLLRNSIKDQEKFLSYFAVWEASDSSEYSNPRSSDSHPRSTDPPLTFRGRRLIHHRSLSSRTPATDPRRPEVRDGTAEQEPALLTTYHPLLIEAHFSVLLNLLLLGDFTTLLEQHSKSVKIMEYLEGYPIFLPSRSSNQSEYAELVERLAFTWLKDRETRGFTEQALPSGDLKSLHVLLSFFTEEFVQVLIAKAAEQDREKRESDSNSKATANKGSTKLLENSTPTVIGNGSQGTWAEERARADAERRKIDPSYCIYNTARCEIALAYLLAAVLPHHESKEEQVREKGKGKGNSGGGSSGSGSNGFGFTPGASSSQGSSSRNSN